MTWADLARSQCGVISRPQLRGQQLDDDEIDRLLAEAALEGLWRGLFIVRGAPLTYEASLWSAVLSTNGVLGFATASHLWGMADQPDRIEVIVARHRHLWRQPGLRTHRIDLRPWATTTRHGVPVTTRRETALDHLGRLPRRISTTMADRALQQGWLLPRDFEDRVKRQPGRVGNNRMRELMLVAGDRASAHSERVLHRILDAAGIEGWVPNHDIWHDGALVAVADVAIPEARLVIEVDGMAWHTGADRFQRDRTRQNSLVSLGWTVLRFTWSDLADRPGYVLATIRHHLVQ